MIDTTLTFNAKAVSEQETNEIGYGKNTNTTGSENVTREYTDGDIEERNLYERVLNDTMNVWHEIFKKFESLFMQVW